MTFQATEFVCLVRVYIALTVAGTTTTVQFTFVFLAIIGPISAYLATVPALTLELPISYDGRKVYLFFISLAFTPAFREFLYLRYTIAQPFKIRTAGLQLVQYQSNV